MKIQRDETFKISLCFSFLQIFYGQIFFNDSSSVSFTIESA